MWVLSFILSLHNSNVTTIKTIEIMTAIYTNTQTEEVYKLSGVKNIGDAWLRSEFVCRRNGWNEEMFSEDVKLTIKK